MFRLILCGGVVLTLVMGRAVAQQAAPPANASVGYRIYQQTFYRDEPSTETKWVEETVMEPQERTRWVQVYQTEKRERQTVMQDRTFTVREKVTEPSFEYKNVTSYKPVEVPQTTLVPTNVIANLGASTRPRPVWLRPGVYTDPTTGLSVYRRRGFHWAQPSGTPAIVPALVPQTQTSVAYIPETTVKREPIEVSRFVERTETRKVPVQIEPHEVTTAKWVQKTETVDVPKIIRKQVQYTSSKKVPYVVTMRVAVDCFGNVVGKPEPVNPAWNDFFASTNRPSQSDLDQVTATNTTRKPASLLTRQDASPKNAAPTPATPQLDAAETAPALNDYQQSPEVNEPLKSVLVPVTTVKPKPRTKLTALGGPALNVITRGDQGSRQTDGAPAGQVVETSGSRSSGADAGFDPDLIAKPAAPLAIPSGSEINLFDADGEIGRPSINDAY